MYVLSTQSQLQANRKQFIP